jgi:hypothetical protein
MMLRTRLYHSGLPAAIGVPFRPSPGFKSAATKASIVHGAGIGEKIPFPKFVCRCATHFEILAVDK